MNEAQTIPLKRLRMDGGQRLVAMLIFAALFAVIAIVVGSFVAAGRNAQKSEREFRSCVQYHPPAECALAINTSG